MRPFRGSNSVTPKLPPLHQSRESLARHNGAQSADWSSASCPAAIMPPVPIRVHKPANNTEMRLPWGSRPWSGAAWWAHRGRPGPLARTQTRCACRWEVGATFIVGEAKAAQRGTGSVALITHRGWGTGAGGTLHQGGTPPAKSNQGLQLASHSSHLGRKSSCTGTPAPRCLGSKKKLYTARPSGVVNVDCTGYSRYAKHVSAVFSCLRPLASAHAKPQHAGLQGVGRACCCFDVSA